MIITVVTPPLREIRGLYTVDTITVYQAYPEAIARPAVVAGRLVPPFKRDRMTWIKPSFLWMMYRSGWASKPGQERVLAIEITRTGFEWALQNSCLSHYDPDLHTDRRAWTKRLRTSPVRIQWDPERDPHLRPLPHRSLQIGLSGIAVHLYIDDWIVTLTDITATAHTIHALFRAGDTTTASLLPTERPYPVPEALAARTSTTTESRQSHRTAQP